MKKAQLERVKNIKPFHKCNASIPPHSDLTKEKKYQNVTKADTKTNSRNTENQNHINILKKISIKISLK